MDQLYIKQIIVLAVFAAAVLFCLAGIVIGFWTAISMICEARDKRKVRVKKYCSEVDRLLQMD